MQADRGHESTTRRMLGAFDTVSGGALRAGVRALIDGRHFAPRQRSSPLAPYTQQEWENLHQVCRQVVDQAFTAEPCGRRPAARTRGPEGGTPTINGGY